MRYALFLHKVIWYTVLFVPAFLGSIFAMIFAPVICLFMNRDGYLPKWLKWFEPTDTVSGCLDRDWVLEHPTWSQYKCGWTFIQRNPFYGFLDYVNCRDKSPVVKIGNEPDDAKAMQGAYLLISEKGYFQIRIVVKIPFTSKCVQHDSGWQLHNPEHKTAGMLQLAPIRFYAFGV